LAESGDLRLMQGFENAARMVDRALAEIIPDDRSRLHQAMRYAALGPGKKLRPFFVIETAVVCGDTLGDSARVAAAIECVHCYSLVHDDLPAMDDDDLRRGKPTVHKAFDEATAILAGDALQALAFEILAGPQTHPAAEVRSQLVLNLAKAGGLSGMVGGQMQDIEAETRNFASLDEIKSMQMRKTGALFRFACEAGAVLAQADTVPFRQYADHIGLAFQIADDILDVESDAVAMGKATQKDAARGKATFVDFLGLAGAKVEARRLVEAAVDCFSDFGPRADLLRAAARFIVERKK
jgi:farnesyl diphosphate synthase